jgi:hypothetical protein
MIRGDLHNKEVAFGRIKRLASSGLSLEPFVRSVFASTKIMDAYCTYCAKRKRGQLHDRASRKDVR